MAMIIERNRIEAEARAIADEISYKQRREVSFDEYQNIAQATARKYFMQSIDPILRLKTKLVSFIPQSTIIIHPDGKMETSISIPPEIQKNLDDLDNLIRLQAERYCITFPS